MPVKNADGRTDTERLPTQPTEDLAELLPHSWQTARLATPPEVAPTADAAHVP